MSRLTKENTTETQNTRIDDRRSEKSAQKEGVVEAMISSAKDVYPFAVQIFKQKRKKLPSQESKPHKSPHGHESRDRESPLRRESFTDTQQPSFLDGDSGKSVSINDMEHTKSPAVHINPSEKSPTFGVDFSQAMMGVGSGDIGNHGSLDGSNASKSKPTYNAAPSHAPIRYVPGGGTDLRNIENILIKAGYEFKDLQAPLEQEETVEEAIRRFIRQYRKLSINFNQERQKHNDALSLAKDRDDLHARLGQVQKELDNANNEWSNCFHALADKRLELFHATTGASEAAAAHVRELNKFEERLNRLNGEHKRALASEKTRLAREKEALKVNYEKNIRAARADEAQQQKANIRDLEAQLHDLGEKWKIHCDKVTSDLENQLSEAAYKLDEQKEALNIEHYRQIRDEEEKQRATMNRYEAQIRDEEEKQRAIINRYEAQIRDEDEKQRTMMNRYEAQITQLKLKAEQEKLKLRREIEALEQRIEEEQKISLRKQEDLRKELKQKYRADTLELKQNFEKVKLGLFDRKHFKGLRDRDLTGQFSTIIGQVRDFANLDWDLQRKSEWPLREDQLRAIHEHNIRKLKKQLVQNSLWIILYKFIFQTPFQILGAEGRELDSDWIHIHTAVTNSLDWPEIPDEVEKQRIETTKAVLTVIEPSLQAPESDLWLKDSFENAIEATLEALYRALSRVASLEVRHRKALQNLVRLCAKTWMQFGSQPYRLIVTLPTGSGDLLSSPQRSLRALTLIISPELKRYGNSQGENLTRGEVVPDCQAAVQAYPTE